MSRPITIRYFGLSWAKGKQPLFSAHSQITPHLYTIHVAGDDIVAFVGFYLPTGEPHPARIHIGKFRDLKLAQLACERHDFLYFRALCEDNGQAAIFVGSENTQSAATEIERAAPGENLADLLIDLPKTDLGVPFHRAASFFEARKDPAKQNADGNWIIPLNVRAKDIPGWLRDAPKGTRLTIGAMRMATSDSAEDVAWAERHKEAFTRAHLLPQDPLFQEWLGQRYDYWGLIASAKSKNSDAVAMATQETLKRILGIPTRRDLHTNRDAVERLEALDREFYTDLSLRARQSTD